MAADAGKSILMFGVLGAGGYLIYEYMQYSSAINTAVNGDPTQTAAAQQALPFFTYLSLLWGFGSSTATTQQVQMFQALQAVLTGTATTTTTPGTTGANQVTSVSTTPPTTPPPPPPAPQPTITRLPVTFRAGMSAMASQMQTKINMTMANADQWNYAYNAITGTDISTAYGFSFDTVYGPVVNGARSSGNLTAQAFLNMAEAAATQKPASSTSGSTTPTGTGIVLHPRGSNIRGFGSIATYPGPRYTTTGNMIYSIHHPYPYVPSYSLKGLGAVTQPMGFEKALYAGIPLRSNKVR